MTREQRFKYEMFVRVRDFGAARSDRFPESSRVGQAFGRVSEALAAIDGHLEDHVLGVARMREVKASRRAAVYRRMKAVAGAGRRVTGPEPETNPFRLPRPRSLAVELSAARLFLEEAAKRGEAFDQFGLPATFLDEFRVQVDELQRASNVRLSSKTMRSQAMSGIRKATADGMEAVRVLDILVGVAMREADPVTFDAWTSARRVEGRRPKADAAKDPKAKPPAAPPAVPHSVAAVTPQAQPLAEERSEAA